MIEKIRKYSFLIFHNDYEPFLLRIRELGVVHIQRHKSEKEIEALQSVLELRNEVKEYAHLLASLKTSEAPLSSSANFVEEDGKDTILYLKQLLDQKNACLLEINEYKKKIADWQVWGDFEVSLLEKIRQGGYIVDFYTCPSQQYKEVWEEEFNAVKVNEAKAHTYFVTIQKQETHKRLEAEWITPPSESISSWQEKTDSLEQELQKMEKQLVEFANTHESVLRDFDQHLSQKYEFLNALEQADRIAEDKLMWLEGWIPENDAPHFEKALQDFPCYVSNVEITDEDAIPIKLKNNRFARLFEPITKMYSLPNYRELDVTSLFAPFFMLFFSLCFGDAGYGLLILLICTFMKKKVSPSIRSILSLGQWLGGTATVVGLLLGTAFGLIMPWAAEGGNPLGSVRDTYFLNQTNLMYLSVALGILQIVFGKTVAAMKVYYQRGWRHALSYFGWVAVIVGLIVGLLADKWPIISYIGYGVAVLGGALALFYNSPGKNILMNFGSGLWNTYNTASGLLGDTLSYIRLFAIGLTSGILGGVFNNLAVNMSSGLPIGVNFLVLAFILLFGHGLNMGLAIISSLVHPLRLTFVEFYKNAEFEGGGREYSPFSIQK